MARTITLADFRAGIRRRGGWVNSRRVTDAFLNDVINEAITEVWDLLIEKWADYYSSEFPAATVIGVDSVSVPTTFYKLRKLELRWTTPPDEWVRLRPHDLESSHLFQRSGGRTFRYRLQADKIRLVPTPAAVETLRLTYIPYSTVLTADGDTFDGINGYEKLVMQHAIFAVKDEMDLDTTKTEKRIAAYTARIRTAADGRDAAEAFYLDPHGPRFEEDEEDAPWG